MHLYWSCGIISWEVNALHAKWSETGIGDLEQFLSMEWRTSVQSCTPSFRKRLGGAFNFEGAVYKGSASNLTMFFPLFHYFLSRVLDSRGLLMKEMESFNALRRISIELRSIAGSSAPLATERLQELQVAHQSLVVEVYSESFVKPKHHQRLHAAEQLKQTGFYVDCFAMERKHKQFKSHIGLHRYDPKVQEDKGEFSHFVQREIWKHHITSLAAYQFGTALQGKQSSSDTIGQSLGKSNCMVAKKVLHKGHTYSENDVLLGAHPCTVDSAVQDGTEFYLLIQPLEIEERTEFWSSWRVTGRKRLLHISLAGRSPTWWLQLDAEKLLCLH